MWHANVRVSQYCTSINNLASNVVFILLVKKKEHTKEFKRQANIGDGPQSYIIFLFMSTAASTSHTTFTCILCDTLTNKRPARYETHSFISRQCSNLKYNSSFLSIYCGIRRSLSDETLFTVPIYIPFKVVHFLRNLTQNRVLFGIIIKLNNIQSINAIFRHIRLTLVVVINQQVLHILSVSL
jgi:hypothetical protein